MSTTLKWKPVIDNDGESLSREMKSAIQKRYDYPVSKVVLGQDDIGFLEGLYAAGIQDAVSLIEAINTHYSIELNEA